MFSIPPSSSSPYQPFVQGGHARQPDKLPSMFKSSTVPVVHENTIILGATHPTLSTASPKGDGWFISDFYAFNYLFKGLGMQQTQLTAVEPADLVEEYRSFPHGSPYEERKICPSQELLDSDELSPVTVAERLGLYQLSEMTMLIFLSLLREPANTSLTGSLWAALHWRMRFAGNDGEGLCGNEPHLRKVCLAVNTPSQVLPTLAVEVGRSERHDDLLTDMKKLLIGGDGVIKAVIIIKGTRQGNSTVGGILELYRNDRQGIPKHLLNFDSKGREHLRRPKHGTSGVSQSIGRSYGSGFANACGEPGQPSKPTP
ncbi:hypothetical protein PENPOL_c033G05597 [Penicillium polonicum]|uniref:Uncharacterized protein n=1 Tax=Penicillium polonicum TaxID=60169 RepID=A0A1V6N5S0_PENPO|nr:hypothetical protein PENPOL_c033G05597 [Penicillium polonicum]